MKVKVTVKPDSRKGPLMKHGEDGGLVIYVREPAHEGRANQAVIKLLADYFKVPKTRVKLTRGASSKHKTFDINN